MKSDLFASDKQQIKSFSFSNENQLRAGKIIARYPQGRGGSALLPLLDLAQRQNDDWLPKAAIRYVANFLNVPETRAFEVATFYHHFDVVVEGEKPPPPITLRVCDSITCEMLGAEALIASLESSVTDDVRVQRVPCVGRCEQAPVAVVGQRPVPRAELTEISKLIRKADTDFGPAEAWIRLSACPTHDPQ